MTSKQRAYLRKLANPLDSIFQVGKSGITPEVVDAVSESLEKRELIKVTLLKNCVDDIRDASETLAARTRSEVVQVIGRKFVLFRVSKENPKIELPKL